MRFTLEVKGWIRFEAEHAFEDVVSARRYGTERFSQNAWRVRDTYADIVVYNYDPVQVIEEAASLDVRRFERSERWVQEQAERQRRRLADIATRQRRTQRPKKQKRQFEKVNWMAEGF